MAKIVALSHSTPFDYGPLTYEDLIANTSGLRGSVGSGYGAAAAVAA